MKNTSETIAALSDEKRALLELQLNEKKKKAVFPVSAAQRRLWFLDQLDPGNTYHNIPAILRIRGRLNVQALQKSLNELVDRHEILRTTVQAIDGNPAQIVKPYLNLRLSVTDLTATVNNEERALNLAKLEIETPFDLVRGPLIRTKLLRLAEEDFILVVVLHHVVTDGWSMTILVGEVRLLYQAFAAGHTSPLPPLPIQYADYAMWQQDWLKSEKLQAQLAYWKQKLAQAPPTLELFSDRPRSSRHTMRSEHSILPIPNSWVNDLKGLMQREGVTLFMILFAAYQIVLFRHSGQQDFVIGAPVANRSQTETENLIGLFINMLALRCDLSGNPTVREILLRARAVAIEAFTNQDVPMDRLVEELQPERSLTQTPLFQVVLLDQPRSTEDLKIPGLTFSLMQPETGVLHYEMLLTLEQAGQNVSLAMEYQSELFDRSTIVRLMEHLIIVLRTMVMRPQERAPEITLVSDAERKAIVGEWNRTYLEYPRHKALAELVEEQVNRTPSAVAVKFEGAGLTYEELNRRANQLAHYLLKRGLRREERVALCLDRSFEMIVGVLGVLKAGGAYVPLDPSYPVDRLRYMTEDSGAKFLLMQMALLNIVEPLGRARGDVICLDRDWPVIARESERNPSSRSWGNNLAYIIYTSGSTGRPKGVSIEQQAILNRLWWAVKKFSLSSDDAVLQKTPFSFDASVWEIFAPLLAGASVVVARPGGQRDSRYLIETVEKEKITILQLVPSMLRVFLQEPGVEKCAASLRWMFSGGEALTGDIVETFQRKIQGVQLENLYGPTEVSIDIISWTCGREPEHGHVPLGCPIFNTEIYILDEFDSLAPIGVVGEIHAGGAGLARGYWNRANLTAEKFIPNAFSESPGARLYRTGDLGRYRADGVLEYLGRRDQQVKIRGYRIELGEIEAMIADCDGVKEAAVVVRQSVGHDKHLVGYVVPKAQLSDCLNTEKLKEDLRKQLPEYMIPPLFVELQHMPRTGSGKLDRGRLPNPDENRTQRCPMPRAGVEELLAQIWTDVLKVDQIDCEDNFFKLGGHSLLAAQLVARVREVFRVDVPLRMIFDHPSLESMSRQIQIEQGQEPMLYEGIRPRATSERRRLSYEQHALWLTDRLSAGSAPYNLPTAVKLEGDLNVEALRIAMNEVVRRHEILRTHFELGEEGEPEQVIVSEMHLECPLIEVLGKNEEQKWEQVRLWAAQEAEMGFDLKSGPLMRAKLLRVSEQMHVALLTLHHIISDGWSQAIMVEEISKIYRAQSEQKHHLLEDLPIQYGDYAAWQKDWLRPEILDRQLDYWRRQLEGIDALLNLPTDYTRPSVRSYRGGHHRVELPDKLGFRLQELARRQSATLFMLLLAAFKVLLWRLSGSTDIPVSTSIANRTTRATERLIGLFLNTLVLRTRLDPAETFLNLLEKVRQNALGAYAHRDLPFENLVHNLERGKKPEYSPLFQVMFILQNFPINKLELPRLSISQLDVLPPVSKCDLTLFVSEEQGRIGALFEYSTDLFDPWTIENMSRTFILLLLEICNDPNRALGVLTSDGHETREMIDSFLDSID